MSKRDISIYIVDIYIAYDKIKRYIKSFKNGQQLLYSEIHWDATIRELQIIGEATKILLQNSIIKEEFRKIVNFRNQITHEYFGIDAEIVWDVVSQKLDYFIKELNFIIKKNHIELNEAISFAIEEQQNINAKVTNFLKYEIINLMQKV